MDWVEARPQTTTEHGQDDTGETLRQIVSRSRSNVVSHLLAIEQHALEVRKAHVWAENPLCLVYEEAAGRHFKVIRNRDLQRPFVAISWTWQPSSHESAQSGSYRAEHSYPPRIDKLEVRDCVLARITKYLRHKGLKLFWMDQVCIDQSKEEAKVRAMNSMDLIYKNAEKTLGLLSTPIESTLELRLLLRLMSQELTVQFPCGLSTFRPHVDTGTIERTMCILKRLTADIWWKRAWIFQEEYVAGIKIDLLFPLDVEQQMHSDFEQIPGEFCVSASSFRQEATLLLRAYQQSELQRHQDSCVQMLKIIGKYQILLQRQSAGSVPMSATIHAEIHKRCLRDPWDRLAIAANSCDYGIRLDHTALSDQHSSISMSLLAQYLLNGEIFVLRRDSRSRTDAMHVTEAIRWMQISSLKGCKPPTGMDKVSFLKLCRLPDVSFCEEGVRTRGLIWLLERQHVLDMPDLQYPQMSSAREERLCCQPWAAEEISHLVYRLRNWHQLLADELDDYIQKRTRGVEWTACFYMDRMMWELVQAIHRGFPLRIGYTQEGKCTGIFIPALHDVGRDMYAFTAWQFRKFAANSSDKFVSLRVGARQNTVTSALEWMNGLVFFRNDDLQEVTFAWPESWLSRSYSRAAQARNP